MEFLGLLLINVFIGVIFYLIITLKLEKSASDFREKKLWEEMDKMIQEFNATAERNISILEKKIRIMRTLLEKSGELKKIDLTVEDADDREAATPESESSAAMAASDDAPDVSAAFRDERRGPDSGPAVQKLWPLLKEAFYSVLGGIAEYLAVFINRRAGEWAGGPNHYEPADSAHAMRDVSGSDVRVIEKDFREIQTKISHGSGEDSDVRPSEDDIMMIISSGKDRHSTVSLLHRKGCPDQDISHYMGIPVGEVRLILNLTDSI